MAETIPQGATALYKEGSAVPDGSDPTGYRDPNTGRVTTFSVPSTSLQPSSQINVPQTDIIPTDLRTQASTDLLGQEQLAQQDVTKVEGDISTAKSDYASLVDQLSGKTAEQQQLETGAGLPEMNTELRDLQNLARKQQTEYIQGLKNIEAGNIRSLSTNQQVALNRQKAIDSLLTQSLIDAKTNNILTAQSKVDRALSLKYDPILTRITAYKDIINNNYQDLSRADKKLADKQRTRLDIQTKEIERKQADEKIIHKMISDASPYAPVSVLTKAQELLKNGASPSEVAMSLGVYGGDYLKNELLKEQIKTAQSSRRIAEQKADGTNLAGKPLKVSNKEITDINDVVIAKNSIATLVKNFKQNITDYGTGELMGSEATDKGSFGTLLKLAIKNLEKTGALDAGTIQVLSGIIPENEFLATDAGAQAKLDTLLNTVNSKTDEYINSYRGTSAETDPRTKRIYETPPIVSTGNPKADEHFKLTSEAMNKVNTSMSTPNAVTAGYKDNQK